MVDFKQKWSAFIIQKYVNPQEFKTHAVIRIIRLASSKEKLFRNIDTVPKNYIQKYLIIDGKTKNILKKYKMKNSELIVFSFLRESLLKYYKACGFKVFY